MSQFIGAFRSDFQIKRPNVSVPLFAHVVNGIATRHSDTLDTSFLSMAKPMSVGLAAYRVCEIPREKNPAAT